MSRRRRLDVVWALLADRDLRRAFDYLAARNRPAAKETVAHLVRSVGTLVQHSEIGPVAPIEPMGTYREFVVPLFKIFYRLEPTRILIVRVWDTRRDPEDFII